MIKVIHWNMGSTFWERKIDQIQNIIADLKPDLMFISKANLLNDLPANESDIEGYDLIRPKTSVRYGHSRLVLLIREEIDYSILANCMSDEAPAIWVKIVTKSRRPITIGSAYREHKIILQPLPNDSGSPAQQIFRWNKIVEGWKKATKNSRCFFIGDTNLDYLKWLNPDAGHRNMVNKVKTDIETLGYYQLISKFTRCWFGQPESLVDQIWTNSPGLVMDHFNLANSFSDHQYYWRLYQDKEQRGDQP